MRICLFILMLSGKLMSEIGAFDIYLSQNILDSQLQVSVMQCFTVKIGVHLIDTYHPSRM